jgi:phosphatidylinositol alpha-mannosyltransferase
MRERARQAHRRTCRRRHIASNLESTPLTGARISTFRRIRIGFVSHVFWPEKRRGGERLIRDLSDALIARGHEPRLITSHRGRPERVIEDGLEVVRQWRPPERPFNRLGFPAGTSHALPAWWALRRGNDDVVHGWTAPAAIAAAHSGKPSVYIFQGVLHENDFARPRVRSLVMRAARNCDVVTTYSDLAAREFERLTGIEARAIEPGIRLDAFTPEPVQRGDTPVVFCAADPDEPRKRVRLLVDAFTRLRRERPDAELWLMKASDPAIASTPGVRIVDPGADRDELVRLYRSAWVTVLPAFREAFGLVVVESLACGTPVIGMRDGGAVPGLLEPRGPGEHSGWIADPNVESLAATLSEAIAAAPTAEIADPFRQRAEDFSIERCAERYEALYRELG